MRIPGTDRYVFLLKSLFTHSAFTLLNRNPVHIRQRHSLRRWKLRLPFISRYEASDVSDVDDEDSEDDEPAEGTRSRVCAPGKLMLYFSPACK